MAHFAELDGSNTVLRVVVVSNDIETAAGPLGENDGHADGETWCGDFFGGTCRFRLCRHACAKCRHFSLFERL